MPNKIVRCQFNKVNTWLLPIPRKDMLARKRTNIFASDARNIYFATDTICLTTYWQNNLDVGDNSFHINLPNTYFFLPLTIVISANYKMKFQVLPPLPLLTSPEPDNIYFTTENPGLSPTNLMEKFWILHSMKKQF